jgi:hypothetical protein
MSSKKNRIDREVSLGIGGSPDWVSRTEDFEVGLDDLYNEVTVPAAESITGTLPNVRAAKGREYTFVCVADNGGTGVSIEDQDDAIVSGKNYSTGGNGMTAVGDAVVVKSNGYFYEQRYVSLT